MKIFLDTAHSAAIKKWANTGIIDGVTTNPTNLSKEGGDPTRQVQEICTILPHGIINVEVVETEPSRVYDQAKAIAHIASNIAVKIPCHTMYYEVIKQLVAEEVVINITLVFSLVQALMMAKLGVQYISPFIGRLDENGEDGLMLVAHIRQMIDFYSFRTQILAASIRDQAHFEGAIMAGADVATLPVTVFEHSLNHALTDKGMAQFSDDWKKLNIVDFPAR